MTTLSGREWSPTGAMDMGARSAPGMRQAAATEHRPDGQAPQHLEIAAQAGPSQELFLAALARLEQWLAREQIPYAVFGSVAACAWTDQGVSLDFNRTDARDPAERLPDIDVLVPRASIGAVRSYASAIRRSALPVSIDTFWAECWIDFRPGAERSYLTHRAVRLAVPTELFTPRAASFLGQDVTVLDPRTLLHIYGTVGVVQAERRVPDHRTG